MGVRHGRGPDSPTGGPGAALLQGQSGGDTYFVAFGDGQDTIADVELVATGVVDRIRFAAGIGEDDIRILAVGPRDLVLGIAGTARLTRVMRANLLDELKAQGARVLLLTEERWRDADWPRASLDDIMYMPSLANKQHVINAVAYLARGTQIDRILPLDDYEVETAAALREPLRLPGMGETTARYFRDKLAMRVKARTALVTRTATRIELVIQPIAGMSGALIPPEAMIGWMDSKENMGRCFFSSAERRDAMGFD